MSERFDSLQGEVTRDPGETSGLAAGEGEPDDAAGLIATTLDVALVLFRGAAAALLSVAADGAVEVLSRIGGGLHAPLPLIEAAARAAAREGHPTWPDGTGAHTTVIVPLEGGAVLLVERTGSGDGPEPPGLEHLLAYASVAGAALARLRPRAGAPGAGRGRAGREAGGGTPATSRGRTRYTFDDLVGAAPAFVRVVEEARRAARSDVPVLLSGESGTGKEMMAQAIHAASRRAGAAFLGINVAAIPRGLLESELFGYEGGAFTGARAGGHPGKFELAGHGTLLLDEIGELPLDMQAKLLRVLQERVVLRLGATREVPVRARVVATSHRDLAAAVREGTFRLDLYHRLCVVQLRLPPLRERREDLPLLVEHHLGEWAQRSRRRVGVTPRVLEALRAHDWPGNVRELANVLEGELSLLPPGERQLTRIPPVLLSHRPRARSACAGAPELLSLAEVERRACEASLEAFGGNVTRAAACLGIAKSTLYGMMRRYGLGGAGAPLLPADEPRRAAARPTPRGLGDAADEP